MNGPAAEVACAELDAIAFKKEKSHARRFAARSGVAICDALRQVLCAAASPRSLAELITDRRLVIEKQDARRQLRKLQQADAWQRKRTSRRPPVTHWQGWFDGSASPNPGQIGIGAVLRSPFNEFIDISRVGGLGDSSQAEYLALLALLGAASLQGVIVLTIYGDSRTVIDDVTDAHRVESLAAYRCDAQQLCAAIGEVEFRWIPRAQNSRADGLSQKAARQLQMRTFRDV